MITKNLEHLLTPQPSVPHRTAQERGHSTERPASVSNSHQNHLDHVFEIIVPSIVNNKGVVKAATLVQLFLCC